MFNKIYENIKQFIKENYKYLLVIFIILILFYIKLPFVIYKSGGTIDLSKRVETKLNYESDGSLSMCYVSVVKGTPGFILMSYILPDWDLVSIKDEFGDTAYEDVVKSGKEYMDEGIDNAIISAFNESEYDIEIKSTTISVGNVLKDSKTDLQIGDEIISIEAEKVTNQADVKQILSKFKENDKVIIKVKNNKKEYERYAKLINTDDGLKLGIIIAYHYDYETEIPVKIKMKKHETGSSGGFMMALSIYNSLTKEDITGGKNIVGTGTIDAQGNVGRIDGIKYKILGAEKKHADIFFVPKENYKEAIKVKNDRKLKLKVVKVETLKDAINYLENNN